MLSVFTITFTYNSNDLEGRCYYFRFKNEEAVAEQFILVDIFLVSSLWFETFSIHVTYCDIKLRCKGMSIFGLFTLQ